MTLRPESHSLTSKKFKGYPSLNNRVSSWKSYINYFENYSAINKTLAKS